MLAGLEKADGAYERRGIQAFCAQPRTELGRLGLRADQTKEGRIAPAQHVLHDLQVKRVAVGHHKMKRPRRRLVHHPGRLFFDHHSGPRHLGTRIEPLELARQPLEDPRNLRANMTRAVKDDLELRWFSCALRHAPKSERHTATATLP